MGTRIPVRHSRLTQRIRGSSIVRREQTNRRILPRYRTARKGTKIIITTTTTTIRHYNIRAPCDYYIIIISIRDATRLGDGRRPTVASSPPAGARTRDPRESPAPDTRYYNFVRGQSVRPRTGVARYTYTVPRSLSL